MGTKLDRERTETLLEVRSSTLERRTLSGVVSRGLGADRASRLINVLVGSMPGAAGSGNADGTIVGSLQVFLGAVGGTVSAVHLTKVSTRSSGGSASGFVRCAVQVPGERRGPSTRGATWFAFREIQGRPFRSCPFPCLGPLREITRWYTTFYIM